MKPPVVIVLMAGETSENREKNPQRKAGTINMPGEGFKPWLHWRKVHSLTICHPSPPVKQLKKLNIILIVVMYLATQALSLASLHACL